MKQKLKDIYSFLNENRSYNMPIQIGAYKIAMIPYNTTFEKVYSLLYSVLNSQSRVKMDKSAEFFKVLVANKNKLNTFREFLQVIGAKPETPLTYLSLFKLLKKQPNWGDKTAALFVKAVYHTHIGYAKELQFWNDAPLQLSNDDELFLPVDAVILHIFDELGNPCKNSFDGINEYIKANKEIANIDVWDDLWFWGFITQKGNGENRKMEFNTAKYWNILDAPKDSETIAETEKLANKFIDLLKK